MANERSPEVPEDDAHLPQRLADANVSQLLSESEAAVQASRAILARLRRRGLLSPPTPDSQDRALHPRPTRRGSAQ